MDGKRVTLEVVAVDDKADAATGKAVAQQLVDAGVVAVMGHLNSASASRPRPSMRWTRPDCDFDQPKFTQLG